MKIIFYGPLGKGGKVIGGGESGNKKTIRVMKRLGFKVIKCEKPYPIKSKLSPLVYPFQLIFSYLTFVALVLRTKGTKSVHISGFYNHLIYSECLLILTSKMLRLKSVYEIRAGGMIQSYENGSRLYRYFFKTTLQGASSILCQGEEYVQFVNGLTDSSVNYYPNFLLNDVYGKYERSSRENYEHVKLVYFGRVAESKNIDFILDVCSEVKKDFSFDLEIIGDGDKEYLTKLSEKIQMLDLVSNVSMYGKCGSEVLMRKLNEKHFFIFPTMEQREGHSNSLTEAMSHGVVPIASDIGFNRSIVNNDDLIVEVFEPRVYAGKIKEIIKMGRWDSLSGEMHKRVGLLYTEDAVIDVIKQAHSFNIYATSLKG